MIPLRDNNHLSKFPFWVLGIILLNIYVFYLELTAFDPESFILRYALIPEQINFNSFSSLGPLITSQFLHGGFLHIISNMLFLWVFGKRIEATLGFIFFPVFYLLSGIMAALAQYLIMPFSSIPMLGASGAIAGVLGAYFALFPKNKIKSLVFIFIFITIIDIPAYFLLFYWFITQILSGVASLPFSQDTGGIAFLSHIGGFIFGWFTALILAPRKRFAVRF